MKSGETRLHTSKASSLRFVSPENSLSGLTLGLTKRTMRILAIRMASRFHCLCFHTGCDILNPHMCFVNINTSKKPCTCLKLQVVNFR